MGNRGQYRPRKGQAEKRVRAAEMVAEGRSLNSVAVELGISHVTVASWIEKGLLPSVAPDYRTEGQLSREETRLGLPERFAELLREGRTREAAEALLRVTRKRTDGWIRARLVDPSIVPPRERKPNASRAERSARRFPSLPVSGTRVEFLPGIDSGLTKIGSTMIETSALARASGSLRRGAGFVEVARMLRVSPSLLNAWVRKGMVPGVDRDANRTERTKPDARR